MSTFRLRHRNISLPRYGMDQRLVDTLHLLQDRLVEDKSFSSLARLVRCCRRFREIFGPGLEGWHIKLQGQGARDVLKDILGETVHPRSQTRAASLPARTVRSRRARFGSQSLRSRQRWDELPTTKRLSLARRSQNHDDARDQAYLHSRRLRVLSRCEVLQIIDVPGAEALVEAIMFAGDDARAFREVKHICLGRELLWRLAERTQYMEDLMTNLMELLEPRHVCFTLGIGNKAETLYQLERVGRLPLISDDAASGIRRGEQELDEIWAHHFLNGTSRVVKDLSEGWAPESITIHNLTAENIPAVYSALTRVFFALSPPPEAAHVDPICWRKDTIATEVADGVAVLNDDEACEFIDAGKLDEVAEEDGGRDPRVGAWTVEQRVWQQIPPWVKRDLDTRVKFTTRQETAACVCCGKS